MKKKLVSMLLVAAMATTLVTGCGSQAASTESAASDTTAATTAAEAPAAEEAAPAAEEVAKPEKITMMVDGTVVTQANGRDAFEARWEELTGIDLVINQPDHDAYYEQVSQTIASGELPDVILLSANYYSSYAAAGLLWDMTDAYENSELKASSRFIGDSVEQGLKIDGKLYGFAPTRGNGCVTYVKQSWLDNCGIKAPTNYDEYIAMLDAFTNGDPDGNGVDGDTYAVSAAGYVGSEAPFTNYMAEFYQDAYPSFYQKEDGTWVDGFTEDSMKAAMQRIQDAANAGYLDPETLTNGTKDCRNKFYEDKFGVFTYWAGTWATNLKTNLEANDLNGDLVALPPIAEVAAGGGYFDRVPPVWCITTACENPEGVFKYFIETMLDGGDMQTLWTYGVEGTHWSTAAETFTFGEGEDAKTYEYAEGEFHMLENLETPGTFYKKNHIDPMLSLAKFEGEDPGLATVADEAKASQELFNNNSHVADLAVTTDAMQEYNGDLWNKKAELIAKVAQNQMSVEDAYAEFEAGGYAANSQAIVDSLNALN
ncbi:MAG: ABC transporter substrate-binding protein [Lachnospiraceae bacterium]|nr:ABC transporter substrate-binding protein [Lachnospiraceae bacterium]